ncbi:MAG TPA: hypothetical protein VEL76_12820, partial [Gemmataceae bacterium]|nr:hypothetical protein [Gemmataceae bacterium]
MPKRCSSLVPVVCLGLVALFLSPRGASQTKDTGLGLKPDPKAKPGIEVRLRFSVEELDPLQPGKSFV